MNNSNRILASPNLLPTVVSLYVSYLSYLIHLLYLSLRGLKTSSIKGKTNILLTLRTDKRFISFSGAHVL
jgi:hypothetical protein